MFFFSAAKGLAREVECNLFNLLNICSNLFKSAQHLFTLLNIFSTSVHFAQNSIDNQFESAEFAQNMPGYFTPGSTLNNFSRSDLVFNRFCIDLSLSVDQTGRPSSFQTIPCPNISHVFESFFLVFFLAHEL